MTTKKKRTLHFANAAAFERWLSENHQNEQGCWLKLAKKGAAAKSLSYAEAVDVALCWGWIDGQKDKLDETFWLQKFTRRRARSPWSQINRDKAEALQKSGRMRDQGLAEVERAQNDGRWAAAYASPSRIGVPDDLLTALAKRAKAAAFFATLDATNRYAILYRIQHAKKAETRARNLEKFVNMLAKGETLYPLRKKAKK